MTKLPCYTAMALLFNKYFDMYVKQFDKYKASTF